MAEIRRRIRFYGIVQGVGFRYVTYHTANRYGVTGWVRNCFDGSVEAEFQGSERDIDAVIADIGGSRYIQIDRMDAKDIPTADDGYFEIRD
ncbi:MAG: acylphosphatase [Ruminococcus sp.]|nr:acylphosphatase [Ruminococcus sp.]